MTEANDSIIPSDATYNLSALATRLLSEGRKLDLASKIKGVVDSRSIEVDLMIAFEACDALSYSLDHPMNQPERFRETSEAALMSYIVLLYARATKTDSNERKQYDPRAKFTPEQKDIHKELCDLRDHAVAHFGFGGSYNGDWVREVAILDVADFAARPATMTRRLVVDRALLSRARVQISTALELIRPVCVKRMNYMTEAIDREAARDPDFYKEIHQHPLNAAIFLGGQEQAEQMRLGREHGQARGAFGHS